MDTAAQTSPTDATTPLVLRPLGVGEILDLAISLYRRNWITLVGIAAVVTVPLMIAQTVTTVLALPSNFSQLLSSSPGASSSNLYTSLLIFYGAFILITLLAALAGIFQSGAIVAAVSERYLGRTITLKEAYRRSLRHWVQLLIASIIVGIGNAFGLAMFFAFVLLPCLCFLPLISIPYLLFINTQWSLTIQAIVVEDKNSLGGLGRSWRLVWNSFWRVLLIVVVLYLLSFILNAVPAYALYFGAMMLLPSSIILSTIANSIIGTLVAIFISPIQVAVMTCVYYDLRIRQEGLDLQLALDKWEPTSPALAPTGSV